MPDVALQEKVALLEGRPTTSKASSTLAVGHSSAAPSLLRMYCPISRALAAARFAAAAGSDPAGLGVGVHSTMSGSSLADHSAR